MAQKKSTIGNAGKSIPPKSATEAVIKNLFSGHDSGSLKKFLWETFRFTVTHPEFGIESWQERASYVDIYKTLELFFEELEDAYLIQYTSGN